LRKQGKDTTKLIKNMNTSQFSLANRKHLADLLADKSDSLRSRVKDKLHDKRRDRRNSLIKEYAQQKGAFKVLAVIKTAKERLHELTDELTQLGFEFDDDDDVSLNGDAGQTLAEVIEKVVDKEFGTVDDVDARFDSAQIAMMTVASLEDAEKILKSVSSI
jgi:hypothetical protein